MNHLAQNSTNILRHEKLKWVENAGLSLNDTELGLDLGYFEDFLKLWNVFAVCTQSYENICVFVLATTAVLHLLQEKLWLYSGLSFLLMLL